MPQPGIMITDGGPHPADAWAAQSASHIASLIRVDGASTSPAALAGRRALPRFEVDLADALEKFHAGHQNNERNHLKTSDERLNAPHVHRDELDAEVQVVVNIAKKTPFAEHFSKPETLRVVREILHNHICTVQSIERHWHADRKLAANEGNEHVHRFHMARTAKRQDDPITYT